MYELLPVPEAPITAMMSALLRVVAPLDWLTEIPRRLVHWIGRLLRRWRVVQVLHVRVEPRFRLHLLLFVNAFFYCVIGRHGQRHGRHDQGHFRPPLRNRFAGIPSVLLRHCGHADTPLQARRFVVHRAEFWHCHRGELAEHERNLCPCLRRVDWVFFWRVDEVFGGLIGGFFVACRFHRDPVERIIRVERLWLYWRGLAGVVALVVFEVRHFHPLRPSKAGTRGVWPVLGPQVQPAPVRPVAVPLRPLAGLPALAPPPHLLYPLPLPLPLRPASACAPPGKAARFGAGIRRCVPSPAVDNRGYFLRVGAFFATGFAVAFFAVGFFTTGTAVSGSPAGSPPFTSTVGAL